ncbi:uncharacterized protein LOC18431994 isoform X1 [Amborella trichopoda]|uniref:DUF1995 domain-containing protein n=2 Tax=Amborella trichopoda TaxID=13333 RepID=W1P7E6_AMBTC|nr:uncharacterized protein LOC18431994 isoform X1 [Amborella trichopoda]ERN03843.1 hypothetical protein AMTR_s00078p00148520 [Amborella trichopoda]|eukprot:XP_006842168.1 uncharacterized protein LOC18431994 isoform X1 [Amborella trichopoda]
MAFVSSSLSIPATSPNSASSPFYLVRFCPNFASYSSKSDRFFPNILTSISNLTVSCPNRLTTRLSTSFFYGSSLYDGFRNLSVHAKFEKFEGFEEASDESMEAMESKEPEEEDDSVLPSDLEGAIRQSSNASALFISSGGMRAIVELLIPALTFLDEEGAQAELWELSRIFLDSLREETGYQRIKAIFPDAGAAALLKYRWEDAPFGFASLSDRRPVQREDEIVVMVVPDYQMLEYVERIASQLSDEPPRPLIMWNPRLISEDVGVGYNVRKLRRYFLSSFTTVYSMKPLPSGAVFRCYPGLWKVFYDDKERPNRYLLAKEQPNRPDADELDLIFGDVAEKSEKGPSLLTAAMGMFSSLNRFVKAISK